MPPRFRSRLLAFALVALCFACAAPTASARLDGPFPRERRAAPKPTVGQRAAKIALRAVGVPYNWGGASPASGFDCSGLVHWAYGRLGVPLPHSSYALYGLGRPVRRAALRAGDVLFFSGLGHVGNLPGPRPDGACAAVRPLGRGRDARTLQLRPPARRRPQNRGLGCSRVDVERYGDPGDFLAHAHDFLIAREAEHNVILGLPDRLRARPTL